MVVWHALIRMTYIFIQFLPEFIWNRNLVWYKVYRNWLWFPYGWTAIFTDVLEFDTFWDLYVRIKFYSKRWMNWSIWYLRPSTLSKVNCLRHTNAPLDLTIHFLIQISDKSYFRRINYKEFRIIWCYMKLLF